MHNLHQILRTDLTSHNAVHNLFVNFAFMYYIATTNLTNAVTCTGEAYEEIAKLVDDQPRNDWEHLGDTMHDYRGMLAGWPGIIQVHSVR